MPTRAGSSGCGCGCPAQAKADVVPARWIEARGRTTRFLTIAAMGGVAALGQAPFSQPALALLGLALGFRLFANAQTPWRALRFGLAFGTGYFLVALHWIVEPFLVDIVRHGWMAPFALLFISAGLSLFWAAAFGLARWIGAGRAGLVLALTGAELLRAYLFTGFPWAMPSYAWVDGLAGQGAAWIGSHGLNLMMFAAAALLSLALRRGALPLGGFVVALAVLTVIGDWSLPAGKVAGDRPLVRLVQPNAPQHQKWEPEHIPTFFNRAIRSTLTGGRADLIIWPETSIPVPLNHAEETLSVVSEAAGQVPVLAGLQRLDGMLLFNSAILISETGEVAQVYDKHHLVPFGEYLPFGSVLSRFGLKGLAAEDGNGYAAGPGPRLMDLGVLGKALPLICYEAVFPQDVAAAPERPDLLVQITNDAWFGRFSGPFQHMEQARMRSIEQGLPMLRAANTGISAVIDGKGRVMAQLGLGEAGHVDSRVPAADAPTLYGRTGDLPIVFLLGLALAGLTLRRVIKTD